MSNLEWRPSLIGKEVLYSNGLNVQHSQVAVTSDRQIDHRSAQALFPNVVYPFNCEVLTYHVYTDQ